MNIKEEDMKQSRDFKVVVEAYFRPEDHPYGMKPPRREVILRYIDLGPKRDVSIDGVIESMYHQGLRPVKYDELNAFTEQYPKELERNTAHAVSEVEWMGMNILVVYWHDEYGNGGCRFDLAYRHCEMYRSSRRILGKVRG
jgi:hypothetical protein